jgi:hypothetical protein
MPTYNDAALTYDAATTTYDGYGTQLKIPYVVVEVAFDDGPYVASPTWTDISSYVRSINIRRGRNDDLSVFTGTANLVLSNNDRRFDPFYTSGPYYGKLLPRRQIRIRSAVEDTTYPVFRGYLAGWPVSYTEAGRDSTVTVEAFDALSLLSTEETPFEWYDYYIRSKNPTNYWRLDDPAGSVITDSTGNLNAGTPGTAVLFDSVPSLATGLSGNAMRARTNVISGRNGSSAVDSSGTACLLFWYKRGDLSDSSLCFRYEAPPRVLIYAEFFSVGTSTQLQINVSDFATGVTMLYRSTPTTFRDNEPHFVVVFLSRTSVSVYVDNVAIPGTITFPFGGTSITGNTAPANYVEFTAPYTTNNAATIQSIALFAPGSVIALTDIPFLYNLGSAFYTETSSSRVSRIISTTSFPTSLVSTPASPAATVSNITNEAPISNELAAVNSSEGGELYVDKSGVIRLTQRGSQNTATRSVTTQAEFRDDGTGLKYGTEVSIQYDADSILNEITLNASDGTVEVRDDASIAAYSKQSTSISTQLSTKADGTTLANFRLATFADPVPAVSPLLVSVTRSAADWKDLLDLELLDQFTFTRTPSVGNAVEVRMLVNSIEHQITPGDWQMRLTGSARYAEFFTADLDFADGPRYVI